MSLREAPPRMGQGSTIDAWTAYARGLGIHVEPSDGRNDIIHKVDAAFPSQPEEPVVPIVEPVESGFVHTDLTNADSQNPTPDFEPTVVQEPSAESIKPGEQRTYYSPYPTLTVLAGHLRAATSDGPAESAKHLGQGKPPMVFEPLALELVAPAPSRAPFLGHSQFVARGQFVTSDPMQIALLERTAEAVRVA